MSKPVIPNPPDPVAARRMRPPCDEPGCTWQITYQLGGSKWCGRHGPQAYLCRDCGSTERWTDLGGTTRCKACEPPAALSDQVTPFIAEAVATTRGEGVAADLRTLQAALAATEETERAMLAEIEQARPVAEVAERRLQDANDARQRVRRAEDVPDALERIDEAQRLLHAAQEAAHRPQVALQQALHERGLCAQRCRDQIEALRQIQRTPIPETPQTILSRLRGVLGI